MSERFHATDRFPPWVQKEHTARYEFVRGFCRNKILVDAACGDGTGSYLFSRAGAKTVLGFDASADAIEQAKRYSSDGLSFRVADCLHLPVAESSADVFVSLETIEHLTEDTAFLEEVTRILKTDGTFICSTPNRVVTNPKTFLKDRPMNPYHVREYSSDEFLALLKSYFSSVEVHGQNPQSPLFLRSLNTLRQVLPVKAVIWIQRVLKCRLLIWDPIERHRVTPTNEPRRFEYIVAVCSGPRRSRAGT